MKQITLPFDFGEQICVSLPDGKAIETNVKSYTIYNDKIVVNTTNGAFDADVCSYSPDNERV